MSEMKRTAPSSRGGRRKPRTKATGSTAAPETSEPKPSEETGVVTAREEAEPPAAPIYSSEASSRAEGREISDDRDRHDDHDERDERDDFDDRGEDRGRDRDRDLDEVSTLEPVRTEDSERDLEASDSYREDEDLDERDNRSSRDSRNLRDDRPEDRNDREPGEGRDSRSSQDRRDRDNRGSQQSGSASGKRESQGAGKAAPKTIGQEAYSIHLYFDKNVRSFVASVLEFPELKVTGSTKEAVLKDLDAKLDTHLQALKRKGDVLPEAMFSRRYPDKLDVRVSQSLHRKLDLLSRQEKVGLDQLVVELLTAAVEKRAEAPRSQDQHRQKHQHPHQHQPSGNQQPRHQHHRRGGSGGRNYQDTMNNRENFMEYVRSLEKGNYRKK